MRWARRSARPDLLLGGNVDLDFLREENAEYVGVVDVVRHGPRLEHGDGHLELAAGAKALLAAEALAEQRGEVAVRRELARHDEVHELDSKGPHFVLRVRDELRRRLSECK